METRANILVVDDEEIVRLSHRRVLTGAHCNVEAVWNGSEALEMLEKRAFDVVILDLRMPGMDGLTVLRKIKERWPECEVVIITGYPTIETAKEAVRLGAHDYLAKPVAPDEMINAATGAILQKKWGLHRDRSPREAASGPRSGPAATSETSLFE